MRCYGLWYGGCSYGIGDFEDVEAFPSVKAAKEALEDRYSSDGPHRFEYVNKETEHTCTPCVGEDSTIQLWDSMPADNGDLYPGSILSLTLNGNAKEERV